MENDNKWMEERLRSLDAAGGFQPDAARARDRVFMLKRSQAGRWMWAAVAAVAGCAALMALPAPWDRMFPLPLAEVPEVATAPDFALEDAMGKMVRLSDYRGKVVLLNFWATWCEPCRHEIPWFMELQEQSHDRGFVVLGVAVDEGWDIVRPYIEERKMNYPVMVAGIGELPRPYGDLQMLPMTYLIDREGHIRGTYNSLATLEQYRKWVAALLSDGL